SHRPQFSPDSEEDGLKLILDMVNASTRYIVKLNSEPIENITFRDVDVFIVAGPDASDSYSETEIDAISEMLSNGSSLLVLGDPTINQTSVYWDDSPFQDIGDNIAINNFLDQLNMTGPRFSINATEVDNWSDVMFDYEHAINESYPAVIRMDSTTWDAKHPIFQNINELLIMSATLKPVNIVSAIATGYESSFSQYKRSLVTWANASFPNMTLEEFANDPLSFSSINGTFPPWMSAFEFNKSRVIIGGSTLMFSGRHVDIPEFDQRWFYAADNARLFMNMLEWLTENFVEAPSAVTQMTTISGVVLLIGIVYYLIRKIRK
ncbi:MAG: hypothetical protein ACFE7R_09780, partial [Candidatus Hodarchaeota archaeon]